MARKARGLRKLESRFSDPATSRLEKNVDQTFKDLEQRIAGLEALVAELSAAPAPPEPEPLELSAQSVAGNPTGSTAAAVSVPIAENELLLRPIGGSIGGGNLSEVEAIDATSGAGLVRATVTPQSYVAVTTIATAANADFDVPLPTDGYYTLQVLIILKLATAGTYRRVGVVLDATRISGAAALVGAPERTGGGSSVGIAVTVSVTGGSIRFNVANSTGENVSGRLHAGWFIEDHL